MNGMSENPKTSIAAVVGALAWLLAKFGVLVISPDVQSSIVMVTVLVVGLFARDARSTPPPPPTNTRANLYPPQQPPPPAVAAYPQ